MERAMEEVVDAVGLNRRMQRQSRRVLAVGKREAEANQRRQHSEEISPTRHHHAAQLSQRPALLLEWTVQ